MASDHGQYLVFNSIDWIFDVRFLEPVITWAVMIDCEECSLAKAKMTTIKLVWIAFKKKIQTFILVATQEDNSGSESLT